MRSLAIMQPYFFPYLGYWQLIKAVDKFVLYDDVNYIKSGWVNRNRILINSKPKYITVPLQQLSSSKMISEMELEPLSNWREKLLKTIFLVYGRAPHFSTVFPVIESLVKYETSSLSAYLIYQIKALSKLLEINTQITISSATYKNNALSGQARVLDICKRECALTYVNAPGGRQLYDPDLFGQHHIIVRFLSMRTVSYAQRAKEFTPNLSIIDVLMENGFSQVAGYLNEFDLLT